MKKIMILSILLLLLLGCDNSPKLNTEVNTASVDGTLELIGASVDTVDVQISITHQEDSLLVWQMEPDSTGYFHFTSLIPGYYNAELEIDSRHYPDYSTQFTAYKDKKASLETITLARIENNCGLIGLVCFEQEDTIEEVNIDIYYKDKQNEFVYERTIQPDSIQNIYEAENLFPGEHKLEFITESFPIAYRFPELFTGQTTEIPSVIFEHVTNIPYGTIEIDGDISDWDEPLYENDHESEWGASNDFENLYLAFDDENLYVGISGGFSEEGNTVNVYFDTDSGESGINDFSIIEGGDIGNNLRKNFTCPESFGANFAFSGWALQYNLGVVSLENPQAVDSVQLNADIIMSPEFIEFSIPLNELYEDGIIPEERELSLVAVIGGGGDEYLADDSIPQQTNVNQFETVFTATFSQTGRK